MINMKVLMIAHKLLQKSGITAVLRNYLLNMKNPNVQVDLAVVEGSDTHIIKEFIDNGNKVFFMPDLSIRKMKKFAGFWDKFFKENKYDVVHSHFFQIDYFVFKAAKKNGVNICISHSHNTKFSENKIKSLRNIIMFAPAKKYIDYWAGCSIAAGKAYYGNRFGGDDRSIVVHNAIDTYKYKFNREIRDALRKKLNIEGKLVIGNVGKFNQQKNKLFLLDILKKLLEIGVNAHLLNVGDGELRDEFVDKMKKNAVEDYVTLTGVVEDTENYLQAMDIFVMPSLYEGLPVVGVEAQANGLPCVFSNLITDEVNLNPNNNRFLALDDGVDEWVREIESLYNCDADRGNGRHVVERAGYDIKHEAKKLEKLYLSFKGEY